MNLVFRRGIHEKGSGDVVSAVCYTIYTTYLSLCTQTSPGLFCEFPCTLKDEHKNRIYICKY